MKIRCMYNNISYELEDDGSSTVLMLKEQLSKVIESETKLSPHNQKWIYKGKVLSDSDTLSASGFTDGDTTHVLQTQSTVTPQPKPVSSFPVPQFDEAMRSYLSMHSTADEISPSLSTINKVISNIIKHPHEEKYRKLKRSNALINKKIVSVPGAIDVLMATGFVPCGDEYVLSVSPLAWEVLVACERKISAFLKKLESSTEPPSQQISKSNTNPLESSKPQCTSTNMPSDQSQQQAMQQLLLALAASTSGGGPPPTSNSQSNAEHEDNVKESTSIDEHNDGK